MFYVYVICAIWQTLILLSCTINVLVFYNSLKINNMIIAALFFFIYPFNGNPNFKK